MEMTKKERLEAALQGRPLDRPPVSFWRHFAGEDAQGKRCVERHVEFYRATDLDFVKVMHDGLTAPCSLDVHGIEDLKAYRPGGRDNPYVRDYLERAKGVVDAVGGEVHVYANVFAPLTLLRRFGDERLRYYVRTDEAVVRGALDALSEDLALLCQLLVREAGCFGVFAAFQGAEVSRYSDEEFLRIVRPSDLKMLHAANEASDWNILHFCAWDEITNNLERWRDYPGRAVNWAVHVEGLSLAEGREFFDGKAVMGGFDNRRGKLLYSGSREEIAAETRRIVQDYEAAVGTRQGLIVGADCSFLTDFYTERFNWVTEALNTMAATGN